MSLIKHFAAQSLNIIEYLEDHKITFRDMKPENLVVDFQTGHLKLVDFGFAKELKDEKQQNGIISKGRTFTKCGTPEYMAPEVIN